MFVGAPFQKSDELRVFDNVVGSVQWSRTVGNVSQSQSCVVGVETQWPLFPCDVELDRLWGVHADGDDQIRSRVQTWDGRVEGAGLNVQIVGDARPGVLQAEMQHAHAAVVGFDVEHVAGIQ